MSEKLTPKQERFIQEYLIDLNATQAAIRAGYSKDTANEQGSRLLANVSISARIEARKKELTQKTELTQEWVLDKLKKCVEKSMQEEEVEKWDYVEKRMIGSGEFVYDSKGATKALELIGKHLNMFKDTIKLEGELGVKIVDDLND